MNRIISYKQEANNVSRKITIAAGQLGPNLSGKQDLIERILNLLEKANDKGVNIIGFPELSLSLFFFPKEIVPPEKREDLFEEIPNEFTKPIFERAAKYNIAMVLPYAEKYKTNYYNSAIVTNEKGEILGKYRKNHLPLFSFTSGKASHEKLYFKPGNLGYPIFTLETVNAKIGVQICYDRRFPEGYRILALKGAEIIFNPTNLATYDEKDRAGTWGRCLQSRALENQLFVVGPNKSGVEKGRNSVGESMIISAVGGEIITQGDNKGDELVFATIDLDDIKDVRANLPLTRDLRPDLYRKLFHLYGLKD